tara:strand:+ start:1108 stop:1383 length:276 start_codon:yes stop_codon:yes gene_type:complete
MKCILLPLLSALALPTAVEAFGKYPSSMEAYQACQKARKKGADQLCKQDYGTNQVLLIKNYWCQTRGKTDMYGKPYKKKCGPKKVIKRFRF